MKPCCIATSQPLKEEIQQLKKDLSDSTAQLAMDDDLIAKLKATIEAAKTILKKLDKNQIHYGSACCELNNIFYGETTK